MKLKKPLNIVADIGGTNARFATVDPGDSQLQAITVLPCAEYATLSDALSAYIAQHNIESVNQVCLAVAGPVQGDVIDLPNNLWCFSRSELQSQFSADVLVINDFSAQILSVALLNESELHWIGAPRPVPNEQAVIAALGPGTGLGVAAMTASGDILPSEGGHVSFTPQNKHEVDLLCQLWQRYDRVSAERVLSGVGLENLYWANCQLGGDSTRAKPPLTAPEISAAAAAGDEVCLRTIEDFSAILGSLAGDAALMIGAMDGVYLAGGILPKLLGLLDESLLRQRFDSKGRFSELCSNIPVAIILSEYPGLVGCVEAIRRNGK